MLPGIQLAGIRAGADQDPVLFLVPITGMRKLVC
jgi:hypothetical protein